MSKVSICCTAEPWMDLETSICGQCKDHTTFIDDELHYLVLGIAWYNRETNKQEWILTPNDHENAVTFSNEDVMEPRDIPMETLEELARERIPGGFDTKNHNVVHVWMDTWL